jgi:hypothetical protein
MNRYQNNRKIIQYSLRGEKIGVFSTYAEASSGVFVTPCSISLACRNKTRTSAGYFWRYEGDIPPPEDVDYTQRKIVQLTPRGDVIKEWRSIGEAARTTKLHDIQIHRVCERKMKTTGGCTWRYA